MKMQMEVVEPLDFFLSNILLILNLPLAFVCLQLHGMYFEPFLSIFFLTLKTQCYA